MLIMELKIKSKITAKELWDFLLHHTYSSIWGFTGILISICALLAFIQMCISGGSIFTRCFLIVTALLFLAVQPLRLYIQAQKLMLNDKGYMEPIEFLFNSAGITLTQKEDTAFYAWHNIRKVISTRKIVAIYADNKKVFKIARRDMTDNFEKLRDIMRTYAVHVVVKLK